MIGALLKRIGLAASLGVVAALAFIPNLARAARPNIIVIQTDDQSLDSVRASYRSRSGKLRKAMPNTLRELFRGGTEFTRTYATTPLCSPSRASVLTGQYPHNHRLVSNEGEAGGWSGWQALPLLTENVPVALEEAGYHTAHFGKFTNSYWNGTGFRPETQVPPGWSRWFTTSFPSGNALYYGYRVTDDGEPAGPFGSGRYGLFGPGTDSPRRCSAKSLLSSPNLPRCNHQVDVMTRAAVADIRQSAGRGGGPFYLHLDYLAPHGDSRSPGGPQPAGRHVGSARGTALPRPPNFNEADLSDKPGVIAGSAPRIGRQETAMMTHGWQRTLESLRSVDEGIGAIMRTLEQEGLRRETYVFFTSDNGFFFGQHRFSDGKSLPYESSSRVPLAVTGPGVPRGAKSRQLASSMDVGATVLALARVDTPYRPDGVSLRSSWRSPSSDTNRGILFSLGGDRANSRAKPPHLRFSSVRIGRYKYTEYAVGEEELYDLSTDPWELRNRVAEPRWSGVLDYMRAQLDQLRDCVGPDCWRSLPEPPKPASPLRKAR